ncbi:hypothetical protein BDV41DRAFT_559465 [Aspergillus transmontanensis]|nr:hypothetical protein BDV41DRAFT_559465 [Aspergillus transmontanensis]
MPTDCLNRREPSTQWENMRRKARSLYCMQLQNPGGRNTSFIGSDAYIACFSSENGICKLAVFRQGLGCLGWGSLRGKQRIYKLLFPHDSLGEGIEITLYGLSSVIRAPCIERGSLPFSPRIHTKMESVKEYTSSNARRGAPLGTPPRSKPN